MVFCGHCGSETDDNHKFCPSCGKSTTKSDSSTITDNTGKSMEAEFPDGHLLEHEPWTHTVENIGTTDINAIVFETKD